MVHDREPDGSSEEERSERERERGAKAYSAAMEAVIGLLAAILLGWWLDTKLGTAPWLLFLGLAFGFATSVRRILRMRQLVEEASAEHRNENDEPH